MAIFIFCHYSLSGILLKKRFWTNQNDSIMTTLYKLHEVAS